MNWTSELAVYRVQPPCLVGSLIVSPDVAPMLAASASAKQSSALSILAQPSCESHAAPASPALSAIMLSVLPDHRSMIRPESPVLR